jgi:hypothetical protein
LIDEVDVAVRRVSILPFKEDIVVVVNEDVVFRLINSIVPDVESFF